MSIIFEGPADLELLATMTQFRRDTEWVESRYPEFLERYPDQWIAVRNEHIIAIAASLNDVFARIDEQGIPRANNVVHFMDTSGAICV